MNGFNRYIGMGTIGSDAELKNLEGGKAVATFSIAVNESWVDKNTGQRVSKTEWVRIEAWGGLATWLGTYGKKGTAILVEGKLKTDSYLKDNVTTYSTKVVATTVEFAGSKPASQVATAPAATTTTTTAAPVAEATAPVATAPVATAPVATAPVATVATAPVATTTEAPVATTSAEFKAGVSNDADAGDDMPF